MDFRPLSEMERRTLVTALRGNAEDGSAILVQRRDTTFVGMTTPGSPALPGTHSRVLHLLRSCL